MLTSRLSSKGQVTLPKKVRESIGAKPGDLITYSVDGSTVTLSKIDPLDVAFHAALSETLSEWASAEDEEAFRDL